jgi:hypothetical protein
MTEPGSVHQLDLRFVDDDWKAEPLSWSRKRQSAKGAAPIVRGSGDKPADSRTQDDEAAAAQVDWETQCLACIGLAPPA